MLNEYREHQPAPDNNTNNGKLPLVWLLLDDRPGHATQVTGLARRVKWPFIAIQLEFNFMNRLPNPLLGGSLMSLSGQARKKLKPPFPDLVIGMGRRIVPVARWIKWQSGGRTRVVLLGRKAMGSPADVDLLVSCVHFGQVSRDRMFELVVPPTQVDAESLAAARLARPDPMAALRKPHVVLLVGGPTAQHRFDAEYAGRMAAQIAKAADDLGGDLAIVTSRRTPREAVNAMRAAAPSTHIHVWNMASNDNPYLSYLANADFLAVTGESESMIAEGSATGRPLTIYPLEAKPPGLKNGLARILRHMAEGKGTMAWLCQRILIGGWITPARDLNLMHNAMQAQGLARLFDGSLNTRAPRPSNEFGLLANRLVELVSGRI
jgi:mitochondrial fission protein ELM1